MLELLLELLFDLIVEGSIELGSEKTIPMPLRILAAIIVLAVFFGMGGLFAYMGYEATLGDDKGAAIMFFAVGVFIVFGGIFSIFKMFRKKAKTDKK